MSSDVLNFNRPCSACRRRKVRCDKAQPCNNCTRHRVTCVYEAPRESLMSHQLLQDRVERLERLVEDLAAFSLSNSGQSPYRKASSANSPFSTFDECQEIPLDAGTQIFQTSSSCHIGPENWMSFEYFSYSPDHMLSPCTSESAEEPFKWPLSSPGPNSKDLAALHLPSAKEDVILDMYFDHVEPFIRINHQGYFRQLVKEQRRENSLVGNEFETLMFAAQYITVSVLPARLIQEKLVLPKAELIDHFQRATGTAFDAAQVMQSRSTVVFSALLLYITCQFHVGNCETGTALLGLAGNIAKKIGLHRDPAHYGHPAWSAELRRRMWGHLAALDAQSTYLHGYESGLCTFSDVQRSSNVNDELWQPSLFTTSNAVPEEAEGYSDMTAALMRREVCRAWHAVSEARKWATSCYELATVLEETTTYIKLKFLRHFDGSNPMQMVMTKWFNAMIKSLQITVLFFHAMPTKLRMACHQFEHFENRIYEDCLSCLEDLSQGEKLATEYHWQWAFRWPMPLHVVAGLLSGLVRFPEHQDVECAWIQIEAAFQRYNNEDISMTRTPAWHSIEMLCDQAIAQHPNRDHAGRSYNKRLYIGGIGDVLNTNATPRSDSASSNAFDDDNSNSTRNTENEGSGANDMVNLGITDSDFDAVFFNLTSNEEFLAVEL